MAEDMPGDMPGWLLYLMVPYMFAGGALILAVAFAELFISMVLGLLVLVAALQVAFRKEVRVLIVPTLVFAITLISTITPPSLSTALKILAKIVYIADFLVAFFEHFYDSLKEFLGESAVVTGLISAVIIGVTAPISESLRYLSDLADWCFIVLAVLMYACRYALEKLTGQSLRPQQGGEENIVSVLKSTLSIQ